MISSCVGSLHLAASLDLPCAPARGLSETFDVTVDNVPFYKHAMPSSLDQDAHGHLFYSDFVDLLMPPEPSKPPLSPRDESDRRKGSHDTRLWETPGPLASEASKGGRINAGRSKRLLSGGTPPCEDGSDSSGDWRRSRTYPPPASRPILSSQSPRRRRSRQPERPPERSPERPAHRSPGRGDRSQPDTRPTSVAGTGNDQHRQKRGLHRGAATKAEKEGNM